MIRPWVLLAIAGVGCTSKGDPPADLPTAPTTTSEPAITAPIAPRRQQATSAGEAVLPDTIMAVPGTLHVSRDGRVAAYVVRKPTGGQYLSVGGRQLALHDSIDPTSIALSDDGAHVAYAASDPAGVEVVTDDVVGPPHDGVVSSTVTVSPDGTRVAYGFTRGRTRFMMADGKEYGPYDEILDHSVGFSRDGKHLAWGASVGGTWFMVVDRVAQARYAGLGSGGVLYSPDGAHVLYVAGTADSGRSIIVDGKPQFHAAGLWQQGPVWSPDGNHVGVGVKLDAHTWAAVVDGKVIGRHPYVLDVGFLAGGQLIYGAATETKQFVILPGGKQQPEYDGLGVIVVAPGGVRWAYAARHADKWRVVLDGAEQPDYDEIGAASLMFSQDGKHVAYLARRGVVWVVVEDTAEIAQAGGFLAGGVGFAADGTLCYAQVDDQHHVDVIAGGGRSSSWDTVVFGRDGLRFGPDRSVSFVAGRGFELFTVTLPSR